MTASFATNGRNDLFIGSTGALQTVTGVEAVAVAAQANVAAVLGEMLFAADLGVPYFDVVFSGQYNAAQFEAYARRAILATPDVVEIRAFDVTVSGGVLRYSAVILTTFGEALLNG